MQDQGPGGCSVIPTLSERLRRQALRQQRRQQRRQQGLSPVRVPLAVPLGGATAVIPDPVIGFRELVQLVLWMVVVVIDGVLAMGRLVRSQPDAGDATGPLAPLASDGRHGAKVRVASADGGSRTVVVLA